MARELLRRQHIDFVSIRCLDESLNSKHLAAGYFHSLGSRWNGYWLSSDVSWFVRELCTLLRVGCPVVEALDLAITQSSSRMKPWLLRVRHSVQSGSTLADSMRECSGIFSSVLIEMVHVGETAGTLPAILQQAAEFQERKKRLRNRVGSALLYPTMVLALSIGVTFFLMTVVVPTLLESLQEFGQELPWPTRILKSVSDFLLRHYLHGALAIGACGVFLGIALNTQKGKRILHGLLLRTPVLGPLIMKQNSSRLCMITGTLLSSGVELIPALAIAENSITNIPIKEAVSTARIRIKTGADIGRAISMSNLLPVGLVQVFTLGQNSGELDTLLLEIANDYDSQVNLMADRLASILEPVLIIGLSLIVGFILLATLLPILETGNVLSEQ